MNEYIEREKAFDAVFGQFCASSDETEAALNAAIEEIRAIPAADVRPVVRGRWEKCVGENGVTSACRCSLCGFEDNRFSMFNYCPNCGAKMEES